MKRKRIVCFLLLSLSLTLQHATATQLTLDTTSWNGTDVIVAYDLIDGSPNQSKINIGEILVDSISFSVATSIEDLYFYNTFENLVTLGDELIISFNIEIAGSQVDGYFPDSFSIYLLDSSTYLSLFSTSDPTGADSLIQWDIGDETPIVYAGTLGDSSQNSSPVPEPHSLLLFIIGIASFAKFYRKKSFPILLALPLLVNLSSPSWAISLSPSTELSTQTSFDISGLQYNRSTRTFDSIITIKNISTENIQEPFTLTFPSLPAGVVLTNATSISDEGIPFITKNDGDQIVPNEKIKMVLKFTNRTGQLFPINFRFIRLEQTVTDTELIQGPDSDGNGVRDDLDPIIFDRYENEQEYAAAIKVVKNMREATITDTVESAFNAQLSLNKALHCMYTSAGDDNARSELEFLRDQMMNTRKRIEAWIRYTNLLSGQSFPIEFDNPCEN